MPKFVWNSIYETSSKKEDNGIKKVWDKCVSVVFQWKCAKVLDKKKKNSEVIESDHRAILKK